MSTRCQIGFYEPEATKLEDFEALIYRHCDGYPDTNSGVIADIVPILRQFDKDRGLDDIEYASAWLVAKLKTDYTNIGICKEFHGDIEYFYAVYPDRIQVYDVVHGEGFEPLPTNQWKLIDTISLKES